jgi:hypothetical protein
MTRRWCHFAPRSDNAEDRELEGVPNVMELYTDLLTIKIQVKIFYCEDGDNR